ncbi:MAG: HD domain-containing phosphohydrolase [Chloroflexota bacterium]
MKAKVLITGGVEAVKPLESILLALGCQVILAQGEGDVLLKVKQILPDIILLGGLREGVDDGLRLVKRLKVDEQARVIPVLMLTPDDMVELRLIGLDAGVDDFISEPPDRVELRARLNSQLKVKAYNEHFLGYRRELEVEVGKRTEQLKQAFEKIKVASLDTIFRLSRAAEYKDDDTGAHVQRMSHYSTAIARKMGLAEEFVERILYAAPMHDIGKIGIPDSILKKPGKLDGEEWETMKRHTTIGAEILKGSSVEFMQMAETIALTHHEKWNGAGYLRGLKGSDIPLEGRIVALADVFDALTSQRPYKPPFPIEKAFAIIQEGRGIHFDPDVADAFFAIKDEIAASLGWWKFLSSDSGKEDKLF